jgi:hypothetical protein
MTLLELQEWLGHSTPAATQHYAKIARASPNSACASCSLPSARRMSPMRLRAIPNLCCHSGLRVYLCQPLPDGKNPSSAEDQYE